MERLSIRPSQRIGIIRATGVSGTQEARDGRDNTQKEQENAKTLGVGRRIRSGLTFLNVVHFPQQSTLPAAALNFLLRLHFSLFFHKNLNDISSRRKVRDQASNFFMNCGVHPF